ncbi:Hypothetical protein RMP42_05850 [Roseomonas mucosa]|nr:Hypothetical protein RMP42_05850 [Roseomonas mucosa]
MPLAPDPLSTRTLRALDPMSWLRAVAVSPTASSGSAAGERGTRKGIPCPRPWHPPSPESHAPRRDPASGRASEREFQGPQDPGG